MTIERYYRLIINAEEFEILEESVDFVEYDFTTVTIIDGDNVAYRIEISEDELLDVLDDIEYAIYVNETEYGYSSTQRHRKFRAEIFNMMN